MISALGYNGNTEGMPKVPMRRDTWVIAPKGYTVIRFKADSPRCMAATLPHGVARRGGVDGDHRRSTSPAPANAEDQPGHGGYMQSAGYQD